VMSRNCCFIKIVCLKTSSFCQVVLKSSTEDFARFAYHFEPTVLK